MELDWSTFFLEVLNFAILAWLLVHFFYRPVMNIIAARRQGIQDTLDKAEKMNADAQALKAQYENRLADWEKEKGIARTELHGELQEERKRASAELARSMDEERERARVQAERERSGVFNEAKRLAIVDGLSFTGRLLGRLASPALESGLIQVALEDLSGLSPDQRKTLQDAWSASDGVIRVSSVWPIDEPGRLALKTALTSLTSGAPRLEFAEDPSLVAGICVDIGSYKIDANLEAELRFFGDVQQEGNER